MSVRADRRATGEHLKTRERKALTMTLQTNLPLTREELQFVSDSLLTEFCRVARDGGQTSPKLEGCDQVGECRGRDSPPTLPTPSLGLPA